MLGYLTRFLRPAPPPVVAAPAHPMPVTTDEYRAAVRRRAAESRAERRDILVGLAHVERVRARIQATKEAIEDRESVRSSRWTKDAKGEK